MTYQIGDMVRVLPPFTQSFPDTYEITDIVPGSDGTTAYILGDHGGFDSIYLETA
jgi:hypothetical protein